MKYFKAEQTLFISGGEVTLTPAQKFDRRHAVVNHLKESLLQETNQPDVFILNGTCCFKKGEVFGWNQPITKGIESSVSELSDSEGLVFLADIDLQRKKIADADSQNKKLAESIAKEVKIKKSA
jgi:hypothetical protein